MTALLVLLRRFLVAAPLSFVGGLLLTLATLLAGLGLLATSGWLITGSALAGLGLLVFDTFQPSAGIRFFAVTRTIARYGERLASHEATFRILADLRVRVFRGIAAASGRAPSTARLLARLTSDLDALDGLHLRFAAPIAAAVLMMAGMAVALAFVSAVLAAAVIVPLAIFGLAVPLAVGLGARRDARLRHHALDAVRSRVVDLDRGRTDLVLAGRMAGAVASIRAAAARTDAVERRLQGRDFTLRLSAFLSGQLALVLAALVGAGLVAAGELSAPGFAAVLLATFALGEIVAPLRSAALETGRLLLAARRIAPLVDRKDPVTGGAGGRHGPAAANIRLDDVDFTWDPARGAALAGVSLAVEPGERVALVGPSGSGKSTVLALIAGLAMPDRGSVRIGGAPGIRPGLSGSGHTIGVLGQRVDLFREPVGDAVRLGAPDAPSEDVVRSLQAAGLAVDPDRMLGDGGSGLSGGERRRLALARLMAAEPDVVLLDEPTADLDAATAETVLAAIEGWLSGRTLVIATHLAEEARLADRLIAIENGAIVCEARRGTDAYGRIMARLNRRTDD